MNFDIKSIGMGISTSVFLYLPALLGVPFIGLFSLFAGGLITGYLTEKKGHSGITGGLATGMLGGIIIGAILGIFVSFTWTEIALEAAPSGTDPEAFLRFFKMLTILIGIIMGLIAGIILGLIGGILGQTLSKKKTEKH